MSTHEAPTALAEEIFDLICQEGPISLARYMALALGHPRYGYYMTRDPLGRKGDFITSPEISQLFGELLGLWAVHSWISAGSRAPVHLVELGPGRGTLMADALRAISKVSPEFMEALDIHLVETSPILRARQAETLKGFCPVWHDDITDLPEGPMIVLANEFFDALPVHQFIHQRGHWHERLVGLENGRLAFGLAPEANLQIRATPAMPLDGTIVEYAQAGLDIMRTLATRMARQGGAMLVIDYGYVDPQAGDTLQAMAAHTPVDPLERPGEADITTHVCFGALARAAEDCGLKIDLLTSQGNFLESLGIRIMAERLKLRATREQATQIDSAVERLTDQAPRAMGSLFKVLALSAAHSF